MEHKIYVGDSLEVLKSLPDKSVHCCVTSPPYYNLRDYGIDEQIGTEETLDEYVENLVSVMEEVKRVLRDDGTLWFNIGDSYAGSMKGYMGDGEWADRSNTKQGTNEGSLGVKPTKAEDMGLKPKDLMGVPWRLAFALQNAGWYLRSDIIWNKNNAMPESVTDRCSKSHEYIFMLSKSKMYFYDWYAISEESVHAGDDRGARTDKRRGTECNSVSGVTPSRKNKRTVWTMNTGTYKGAHFATFPLELPTLCVKAGTSDHGCCSECGSPFERIIEKNGSEVESSGWKSSCECESEVVPCTVIDPFSGAATAGVACQRIDRQYVGIELNPEYAKMSAKRLNDEAPMFVDVELIV
jgi:DNA modification methylase